MSETVTMTIAEFLMARIAEDEEAAANASHHSQMMHDYERDNYGHLWVKTPRVLAECEAKRRIVEEARNYSPELADGDNGEWAFAAVLRYLALPFADHPDYREDWKP